MKTQNENWLETRLLAGVYLKYFFVIVQVSTAAVWHVSALHRLGSCATLAQVGSG